ncbi:hypothetical protein GCM10018781_34090 [Kitasatospora indigofera]|uniref:Pterin-4-alpha-carbinolamine dehydratase n=1 Tax=Kitasatospora indigofera TaxID=67307 RepID=A0A919KTJ6_9ACTN|nr:4a-hydroxytetrahydrobiopterin dehydratase [Kitasatospora indigofera]GHH71938.1 hypothetical protein GCM10018781_34090 [Kitasatospora indigofera]
MERTLSRPEASDALNDTGRRYLLDSLRTSVPARSLAEGIELAARAATACGEHADGHLQADVRRGRVLLTLQSPDEAAVTTRDVDLAHRISAAVRAAGSRTEPGGEPAATRTVQLLEIAIDALDPAAVRPFWKAVLGYADAPGASGPAGRPGRTGAGALWAPPNGSSSGATEPVEHRSCPALSSCHT